MGGMPDQPVRGLRRLLAPAAWCGAIGLVLVLAAQAALRFLRVEAPMGELETGSSGDFVHYYHAAQAVLDGADLYAAGIRWYIYPPLFAVLLAPLAVLPFGAAAASWTALNAALIVATLVVGARECVRRFGPRVDEALLPVALLVAALVMSDKIRADLRLGQTDALILLAMTLGLVWVGRRAALCGLAIGFVINIKYQGLVFLPYLLVRRRWREAAWSAAWSAAFALSTSLVFGWERNLGYLRSAFAGLAEGVFGSVRSGEGRPTLFPLEWERSVSIPSVLARAAGALGAPAALVWLGTLVLAAGAVSIGWAIYRRHGFGLWGSGQAPAVVGLEWCGLIAGVLAFSPQTTSRHLYALLLPVLAASVLLVGRRPWAEGAPARWPLLAAMLVLAAGLRLPPGGGGFEGAVAWWRAVGGATWCQLVFFFALLWAGLGWARRLGAEGGRSGVA